MTIGGIITSDCVIQKRKDPLSRGAGTEAIAYLPVQLNSCFLWARRSLQSGFRSTGTQVSLALQVYVQ